MPAEIQAPQTTYRGIDSIQNNWYSLARISKKIPNALK